MSPRHFRKALSLLASWASSHSWRHATRCGGGKILPKMRAIVANRYGPPDVLQLIEMDKPEPEDDQVLVKIHSATVFMGDCEMRGFKFPLWMWLPLRLFLGVRKPKRPVFGQEFSGVIEAVGNDVTKFNIGDEVFAYAGPGLGAYAEYKRLPSTAAIAIKPANMSFDEAATVPTGGQNALHFIRKAELQPGQTILINGAAGSIGTYAVQIAKHYGAEVTAVDSAEKLDMLRSIGADHVVDYLSEDFTRSGKTYDVILDVVGKSPYGRSLKSLTDSGRYILANPRLRPMLKSLWTNRFNTKRVMFELAKETSEDLNFLKTLIEAGDVKSVIDRRYPLEETAEAHRYVETGRKQGHVIINTV